MWCWLFRDGEAKASLPTSLYVVDVIKFSNFFMNPNTSFVSFPLLSYFGTNLWREVVLAVSSFIRIILDIVQHMLHFSFEGIFLIFKLTMVRSHVEYAFKIQACSKLEFN